MGLEDIVDSTGNYISMYAVKGNQLGHEVISAQCTVDYVLKFLQVDKSVQREMLEGQVAGISKYIQYGLDDNPIYFPPLIFSARGKGEFDESQNQFHLKSGDTMVVLDGQHRIRAFEALIKRLESSRDPVNREKLNKLKDFPLTIQIFGNLASEQERQLFTDVNTKSSKASNTLLVMYKENDLCGNLVKDIIYNHPSISPDKFEVRAKTTTTKLMTAATLYNLCLTLNDGIIIMKGQQSKVNKSNYDSYKKNVEDFLTLLVKYAPDQYLNRNKHFIMNPNSLRGIAKCIYFLKEKDPDFDMESLFQHSVRLVDWSHKNKELKQAGIPFNDKTKKYRLTVGTRITTSIYEMLLKQYTKSLREINYV